jgi:ABC-type multidrug transport system fused ATPase/permease subunit
LRALKPARQQMQVHFAAGGQHAVLLLTLSGDLRFEGVSLCYFPGGPLALRHVNFHVQDCEKVSRLKQGTSLKSGEV